MMPEICTRAHCWHPAPRDFVEKVENALGERFVFFDRCCREGCDRIRWKLQKPKETR